MTVHILNGDSLKSQFPDDLDGRVIVARECLVDGQIRNGTNLDALYAERAEFLSQAYGGTVADYTHKVVGEFEAIRHLNADENVFLWFEEDLFCQVNLWFVSWLLIEHTPVREAFLVLADESLRYGFASYDTDGLRTLHGKARRLDSSELSTLADLWPLYLQNAHQQLHVIADENHETLSFLSAAVQANTDRIQPDHPQGRPYQVLRTIMQHTQPCEFGPVFREFWSQESIYGFGDLQVRRMYDQIKMEQDNG